ncbi:MAG: ATP-dependent DNA helicase [Planctomycetota bacterium]
MTDLFTSTPDAILDGLNDAQRRAVTHQDGPMIVLAGPGTGKTRVLTRRAAHLIAACNADPESIVALTFTNNAARELEQRVQQLVGAVGVRAGTFHSFGWRLIQRYRDRLGYTRAPTIIDSAQRRRLLREIVANDAEASRALDADLVVDEAWRTISKLAEHAIEPTTAAEHAQRWADTLASEPPIESFTGDDRDEAIAERQQQQAFAMHVRIADAFARGCLERNWITLDQLITAPVRLLRDDPPIASIIRSDMRHVLVDEFQDVNVAQIELLRLLCPPERHPDLCVVGDDDQAIYRFRGADDLAFDRFARMWPCTTTVPLDINYRSTAAIVDASSAVIARATHRFEPGKTLRSGRDDDDALDTGVTAIWGNNEMQVAEPTVSFLLREHAAGKDWSSFGVIAHGHTDLDRIATAMEIAGIPYSRAAKRSITDDPGVQDLLAWVKLLVDPAAWYDARRLLRRPPISIPPMVVSDWEKQYKNASGTPVATWLRTLDVDEADTAAAVRRFGDLHDELAAFAADASAADAVFEITRRADLAHAELLSGTERSQRLRNIVTAVRFARQLQPRLEQPGDLGALVAHLDDLDEDERGMGRATGEDALHRDDEDTGAGAGAVRLMTAHGSKGLEFDTAIVVRINSPNGFPTRGNSRNEVPLPDGMIERPGDDRSEAERDDDEERRLFYVAATRAERRLVLVSKKWTRTTPIHFVRDIDDAGAVTDTISETDLHAAAGREAPDDLARLDEKARTALDDAAAQARREARVLAASALDRADDAELTEHALESIAGQLREAAQRLAMTAVRARGSDAPSWADRAPEPVRELSARLGDLAAARAVTERPDALTPPPDAPLKLSYTSINDFERCPRCWYAKRVLELGEAPSDRANLGRAVHMALERFFARWRDAEADGEPVPTEHDLHEIAVRTAADIGADAQAEIDQVIAFARAGLAMHEAQAEVLYVERRITFDIDVAGCAHKMDAQLDRVDRFGELFRVVDYKTGASRRTLLEPKKDDLQLGIYRMALEKLLPGAPGMGEYWLLGDESRGSIRFDDLDTVKIDRKIEKAVEGMLSGRYKRGRSCSGLCDLLGA